MRGHSLTLVRIMFICAMLAQAQPPPADRTAVARQALDDVLNDRYEALSARFDARMRQALPMEKLAGTLGAPIKAQFGAFQKVTGPPIVEQIGPKITRYDFPVQFAKASTANRIVLNYE